LTWHFNRKTGSVTDARGIVVADCLPMHGALIESAPDLLKACEAVLSEGLECVCDDRQCAACLASAAIAKALEEK
jgi:hypothetical protein